jgi:RNA polymerase sigma-70 factor (ECF subfamily)
LLFVAVNPSETRCLLERSQSDADAFAEFYDAYAERVLRFMARRVLDTELALDLVSETFAVALERRRQFRGSTAGEEQAWLFAIARSELSHYWRRGRVERDALARIGVERPPLTDRALERLEERAGVQSVVVELQTALDDLPGEQRRAVHLRVIEDQGYEEIADGEGVTQQVARARVSRGLRALASMLKEQGVMAEDVV